MDDIVDIVGLYSDVPGGSWRPNTIMVNMGREDIDGRYEYLAAGGGGVVFLNENKNTILKVNYYAFDDKEVSYQRNVGVIAAEIFYEAIREVGSDTREQAFHGNNVQIVIMEYLDPVNWIPLRDRETITEYQENLFELIYTLIYEHNIQNVMDFVGNTGPHIFMKEMTGEMKVVDYGQFKESTNPQYDFIKMVKELQDVVIPWSKDGQEECYRKIMDLSEEVTDEVCKGLLLYKGREFLEKKKGEPALAPGSELPIRRSQRISSKYGLGISGKINKTSRGGTSKRKNKSNGKRSNRRSKNNKSNRRSKNNKNNKSKRKSNNNKSKRSNKNKSKKSMKNKSNSKRKYRK
jgi:hypothetical protein